VAVKRDNQTFDGGWCTERFSQIMQHAVQLKVATLV
jgi:N-formylglutamate amidohydrolase